MICGNSFVPRRVRRRPLGRSCDFCGHGEDKHWDTSKDEHMVSQWLSYVHLVILSKYLLVTSNQMVIGIAFKIQYCQIYVPSAYFTVENPS